MLGLFLVAASAAPSPAAPTTAPVRVSREEPVTATDVRAPAANNSPVLAVDPTDSRFVVVAHRLDAPTFGCALHVSGDGGRGWLPARPVPQLPEGAETCYAPEVAFDRSGTLYYLFVGLAGQGNEPVGVFLTTSRDRGRTFLPPWRLLGPDNYQARMAIDRSLGSQGRLHLVWLHASSDAPLGALPDGVNPILASHSDDGGRTFTPPVQISDPDRRRVVAPTLALGPGSAVNVAYYDLEDDARDYRGLEGPAWDGNWTIVLATSRDGGRTFGAGTVIADQIVPPGRVMLIFTMPPPALASGRSGLYAAWPDARHGDPDILVARSAPDGRRWEAPVRANDDPAGADQALPRLAVAPDGRVDLVFLDRRRDPQNRRYDVFYTSSDDGRRFVPNVAVTSRSSSAMVGQRYLVPSAEGLFDLGSRLALVAERGRSLTVWPDSRNTPGGTQQDLMAAEVTVDQPAVRSTPWLAIGGAAAVVGAMALALTGLGRVRRRRHPRVEG